jgi:hypothetical protein
MKNSRQVIRFALKLLILTILFASWGTIHSQETNQTSGGTCAVFLQNGTNLAFAIDSAVTNELNGVRTNKKEVACKVWLPNPTMIAATTGLLTASGSNFMTPWNATLTGRSWTESLPPSPSPKQVDAAMRGWGSQLMTYLASHPSSSWNGEVASLLVAFRSDGKAFVYKERISGEGRKVFRDGPQSVRLELSNDGSDRLYSGSCRNFLKLGNGHRGIELSVFELDALNKLGTESKGMQITSAAKLGDLAMRYEALLTDISKAHASDPQVGDDIGPPFQLATLGTSSSRWSTRFSAPCK